MNYYLLLLIFVILLTIILYYVKGPKFIKNNKRYLIIILVVLITFLIIRDTSVGVDSDNYLKIFNYAHKKSFLELFSYGRHEIGYKYYAKIISMIWNNYWFFLSVTSIVSMVGLYYLIEGNSDNYFDSLMIFICFNFYGFYFGILRQVIAISILLYSIRFIKQKKIILFIISVIVASLFHKTAFVFLPAYFLFDFKLNKLKVSIWATITTLFLIFRKNILNFILTYIYKPASLDAVSGGGYKMLVFLFVLSLVAYYFKDKLIKNNRVNQLFINMVFVSTIIQTISTIFSNTYRVSLYYVFAIIPLIPNIISLIKNNRNRLLLKSVMYISLVCYYLYVTINLINYVEYKFII